MSGMSEMLCVVIVPNLPKNAKVEWHAVACEGSLTTERKLKCFKNTLLSKIRFISVLKTEASTTIIRKSESYEFTCQKMSSLKIGKVGKLAESHCSSIIEFFQKFI